MSQRTELVILEIPKHDLPVLKDALTFYENLQDLWIKLKLTTVAERELATMRRAAIQSIRIDIEERYP